MSKIRILPEQLANQIAAGEVVERPASVVKEMIENSIDAGATRIEIEIQGGGTGLIRIVDDGEGMGEDDLLMSLERHGTSKIADEKDLASIASLGFRGEAVPSIGSVSRMTIISRPQDNDLGTKIVLDYGKLTKVHETGCSPGTTVEVRNLFGNTPARKKFLRTRRTELGHIEEVVKNYALGCPDILFILHLEGREVLRLDSSMDLKQRFVTILRYSGPFIPISAAGGKELADTSVHGFLVPPEKITVGPSRLRIFVNNRAVKDRMITHAVGEGLRSFLMKGKSPSGLVHLLLPHQEVDVNVHPAKHEVRFRNAQNIHTFISQAITVAIEEYQRELQTAIFGKDRRRPASAVPIDRENLFANPPASASGQDNTSAYTRGNQNTQGSVHVPVDSAPTARDTKAASTWRVQTSEPAPAVSQSTQQGAGSREILQENTIPPKDLSLPASSAGHHLNIIGQFDNLYIFCQDQEGLLVIDQHAAHERLLYQKLYRQYHERSVAKQTLMFPETVELSLLQSQLAIKHRQEIERMGFAFREFGGNTFVLSSVPALSASHSPRELFLDILDQFGSEQTDGGHILDNILATMACKAAVKGGTSLSSQEINKLLNDMAEADLFSHCPHGRPVIKRFSFAELRKWFHRT
ncbi:MAG: DNA mismatch repair protein MutL [Deltaproteobacteria bacterium]|nr:MAG: DNA mismatch repair protein MutL [Deltaproteobacteria bacterium]